MMYEIIFVIIALAMTALVVALFAWRLIVGRSDPRREWTRIDENVAGLRYEYERAKELLAADKITDAQFKEREDELALRVIDETKPDTAEEDRTVRSLPGLTAAVVALVIFTTSVGGYLYFGDFSALDERAIEQIRLTKLQSQSERGLAETVVSLEKAVASNKDNLEAWEILAEQYNETGNLSQAQIAYENVVRLSPKNANAFAELADIHIALSEGELNDKVIEYANKALELDPYHLKALMIGAAIAFNTGDYANAAILFNRLRAQIPEGNEVHDALTQQIDMALRMGKLAEVPKDPLPPKPETDMEKMMKMGGGVGMDVPPGQDGVGLLPKVR